VVRNRELVSMSREILAAGTGLKAAAIEPTHLFLIWGEMRVFV
jgi:hypothetical protein